MVVSGFRLLSAFNKMSSLVVRLRNHISTASSLCYSSWYHLSMFWRCMSVPALCYIPVLSVLLSLRCCNLIGLGCCTFLGRLRRVDLIIWVSDVRPYVSPYVHPYVRPSSGVAIGSKVKVTRPLKLEILQFSKSISSAIFNVSWQMTIDSETMEQYLNFVRNRFYMS